MVELIIARLFSPKVAPNPRETESRSRRSFVEFDFFQWLWRFRFYIQIPKPGTYPVQSSQNEENFPNFLANQI